MANKNQSESSFDDDDYEVVGPLSAAETKTQSANRDALNSIFRQMAANKSEVSIAELKTELGKHGISVKDNKELEHYFNSMDSDRDKRVTFQDFYVKFAPITEEKSSTDAKVLFETWIMKNAKPYVQHSDDAWKYLVSGGVSGAVSRTATAPIERIKLLQQVQGIKDLSSNTSIAASHAPPQYPGIWKSLVKIGQEEGFVGYFKGNFTNVVRAAPSAAVRFSSFEFFKALALNPSRNPTKRKHLSDMENLAAGAGAGLISTVATYPLDLLRSRLCVQTVNTKYKSLGHAFKVVWTEEGARGFFKGVGTSAYGAVPYVALNFTFYEWLKQRMMRPGEDRPSQMVSLTCGGVSGSVAMTMTYAFELIRRRMMIQGVDGMPVLYSSTMDALVKIYRQEGLRGLHQGLWANYFKVIPSMAIGFWTYELCKSTFNLK